MVITQTSIKDVFERFSTSDGLFAVDSEQRIAYLNRAAERIFGCSAKQAIGKHCFDVVQGRDMTNTIFCRPDCPIMVRAQNGETSSSYDISISEAKGDPCLLNTTILLTDSPEDGTPVVVHIVRDVTLERHMHESARQASQELRKTSGKDDPPEDPSTLPHLSKRELDVLRLLVQGMSNNRIAEALYISPITARNHVDRIIGKLGVKSRLQAVLWASQHHMI